MSTDFFTVNKPAETK